MTENLKKLTWENHKQAERTKFMSRLTRKQITPQQYYIYLSNQYRCYRSLEYYASIQGMFDIENEDLEPIQRAHLILDDINLMENKLGLTQPYITVSTIAYEKYIESIKTDRDKLLAHIYVRHMGDLSGGQMIKKLIPGPTKAYEFDCEPEQLKARVRERLHDGLVDEANNCFVMIQRFLDELQDYFDSYERSFGRNLD